MTKHTTIYLVRHGETIWNAEGRCQGRADSEFSDRGHEQLRELTSSLANVRFDAAYTSPLGRACRTTTAILAGRSLRAIRVSALAELSYGDLQGSRFDDWPSALRLAWTADPSSVHFPNGESLIDLRNRTVPAFHDIVAGHAGGTVLVSAHGHVNRVLMLATEGLPLDDFWRVQHPNGSAVILTCPPTVAA
jgi:broad specificity phosphatase PhoE